MSLKRINMKKVEKQVRISVILISYVRKKMLNEEENISFLSFRIFVKISFIFMKLFLEKLLEFFLLFFFSKMSQNLPIKAEKS